MSRHILEQITAGVSLNTRRFDPKIYISVQNLRGYFLIHPILQFNKYVGGKRLALSGMMAY